MQNNIVCLIIRLCFNTGKRTDHPFGRITKIVDLDRRLTVIINLDG